MSIFLLGGAFDPPHLGHVLCAVHARTVGLAEQVWVLPSARHPYGKDMRLFAQRLELCRLAFADLPWVSVHNTEQDNPSGYTFDLITLLRAQHPNQQFTWIGGSDTAQDMARWHRGAELAAILPIHAVPRRGWDNSPAALPAISSSLVRERLAAGQAIDDLVPQAVAKALGA